MTHCCGPPGFGFSSAPSHDSRSAFSVFRHHEKILSLPIILCGSAVEIGALPKTLAGNTLLYSSRGRSMKSARDDHRIPLEGWRPTDPCTFVYSDGPFTETHPAGSEYSIVEMGSSGRTIMVLPLDSVGSEGVLYGCLPATPPATRRPCL